MRFTPDAAIGLHDANWRSSFGGDIYLTNGSHGCVNLPHDAACQLFDMVGIGTTVVVH
jgi:lipoprotein-anchoring transpeptidase ErfK/SrfK